MGSRAGAKKWLSFALIREGDKTNVWLVMTADRAHNLGEVKWFGRWRGYAFFPRRGHGLRAGLPARDRLVHRGAKLATARGREGEAAGGPKVLKRRGVLSFSCPRAGCLRE